MRLKLCVDLDRIREINLRHKGKECIGNKQVEINLIALNPQQIFMTRKVYHRLGHGECLIKMFAETAIDPFVHGCVHCNHRSPVRCGDANFQYPQKAN